MFQKKIGKKIKKIEETEDWIRNDFLDQKYT